MPARGRTTLPRDALRTGVYRSRPEPAGRCPATAGGHANAEREGIIGETLDLTEVRQSVERSGHAMRAVQQAASRLRLAAPPAARLSRLAARRYTREGWLDARRHCLRDRLALCGAVGVGALALALVHGAQAHPKAGSRSAWPDTPAVWVNGAFATCVRLRESGNGRASGDLYGFLPSTWASVGGRDSVYTAPRAEQDYRAWLLWLRDGPWPWRPYDGC